MANKRIYYAIQRVGIKGDAVAGAFYTLKGVQSISVDTNFNLEQIFELGQISIYNNVENLPDISISLSKVNDGRAALWIAATSGSTTTAPTLAGRSVSKCVVGLGIYPDTATNSDGTPTSEMVCSGLFPQSVSYKFTVEGPFSEDVTFVGNNKVWVNDSRCLGNNAVTGFVTAGTAFGGGTDAPGTAWTGVARRQHLIFAIDSYGFGNSGTGSDGIATDPDCTILPPEVHGITSSGVNPADGDSFAAKVQSITCSVNLGREAINELGRKGPYTRYATFPVEVTTEISVISSSGDMISATETGILTTGTGCGADRGNLREQSIRIATCDGLRIWTGNKNKLKSVTYGGGDTGRGNVTVTYTYSTFNDFTVMQSGDPHASGSAWWTARINSGYLNP